MSIIYDALQKMQQHKSALDGSVQLKAASTQQWKPTNKWAFLFMCGLLLILFTCLAILYGGSIMNLNYFHASASQNTKQHHHHKLKLQLDGIFLSEQNKLAMINHQSYFVGDKIDGLKIDSIENDRVKLNDDEHHVSLRLG